MALHKGQMRLTPAPAMKSRREWRRGAGYRSPLLSLAFRPALAGAVSLFSFRAITTNYPQVSNSDAPCRPKGISVNPWSELEIIVSFSNCQQSPSAPAAPAHAVSRAGANFTAENG